LGLEDAFKQFLAIHLGLVGQGLIQRKMKLGCRGEQDSDEFYSLTLHPMRWAEHKLHLQKFKFQNASMQFAS
jgi:hypothetical protein